MDEKTHQRIKTFFNYWRRRYEFICDLDLRKNSHEANVLIWASLDALSNLWAESIGKSQCKCKKNGKRLIFDAFLAHYGGEIFQTVSLPDVWDRIDQGKIYTDQKKKDKLPTDVCNFLSKIGDRQPPTLIDEHRLRHSSDDWSLDAILTATLRNYPAMNRTKIEEWLIFSRYGAIAYKEMRSAYIHEGRSGGNVHGFELYESAIRPTYLSGVYTTPPIIGFQIEFMLCVLKNCIGSFEADSLALQQDPVPGV